MATKKTSDETTYLLQKATEEANIIPSRGESSNTSDPLQGIGITSSAHPIYWPAWKKWSIIIAYAILEAFISMSTTTYVSAAYQFQEKFGTSAQVTTLGQSMFIAGNALGPAFLGPLSDIAGRKWVYVVSILVYAVLNVGAALASSLPILVVFQFLSGFAGSTALSNVAGTVADLFGDADDAGQPMALLMAATNIGASIGSPVGTLIASNPYMGAAWIFWVNVIVGCAFAASMVLIPETLPLSVLSKTAGHRELTNSLSDIVRNIKHDTLREMYFVTTMSIKIMFTEPIVASLAICNGWLYGLLFLYQDGILDVFVDNYGLSVFHADLTYLNFGVGAAIMFVFFPIQTRLYRRDCRRNDGNGRPEARFLTSLVAVWLCPMAIFWFAFTSNGRVSLWYPIIAGAVLGFSITLVYCAMLSYIADSYPVVAASAVAAFIIPSFLVAAGLTHVGAVMFKKLGTTWAMITIGLLSFGIVGLVYILYFFGPKLRSRSRLARAR